MGSWLIRLQYDKRSMNKRRIGMMMLYSGEENYRIGFHSTLVLEVWSRPHSRMNLIYPHSVPEWIWIKGSYLSQWQPQGERGPPKGSKSQWIEILHGGSQFTLWFLKIEKFQKFSDRSKNFFCCTIHKKLNKSCSLENFFLFLKKIFFSLKKTLKKNFVTGTHHGGFQFIVILTP